MESLKIWFWLDRGLCFFYDKIFNGFKPLLRTTDLDFYVPNAKSISSKGNLINNLRELKYEMLMDTLTEKTIFASVDGFELEFLTKLNRTGLACVKLGNTGIFAESLSYVDIFTGNYIEIEYEGINLKVASPSSYIIQKLLIHNKRSVQKREKDIESIKYVLNFIKSLDKNKRELEKLYYSLPKTWITKINKVLKENGIELFEYAENGDWYYGFCKRKRIL